MEEKETTEETIPPKEKKQHPYIFSRAIAPKIRPNVLTLGAYLLWAFTLLSAFLFALLLVILLRDSGWQSIKMVEAVGLTALFSAWLILLGTIIGGFVSTMSTVADDKDKPEPSVPLDYHERKEDKMAGRI